MTKYIYKLTEPGVYTVGFYDPAGRWIPESDHATPIAAGERVHYLNGGSAMAPTAADCARIAEALAAELGDDREIATGLLASACIAKFADYMTDTPGYVGPVFVIVWPGSPDLVDVLIERDGRLEIIERQPSAAAAGRSGACRADV